MTFLMLKQAHLGCITLSLGLFVLRWLLQLAEHPWRHWRPLKIVPHINDSLLLGAAIGMLLQLQLYPFVNSPWLTAKVCALLVYIGLGRQALATGLGRGQRLVWGGMALLAFGYIGMVAVTKQPLPHWPAT